MDIPRKICVCVTQQRTCERLIMRGYNSMKRDKDNLYVIHVVNERDKFLNNSNDGEALEYLFDVSKKVGAELTVLRSKDVIKALGDFAEKHHITHFVIGSSPDAEDIENHEIAMSLRKRLREAEFIII